jgi:hypothetical protein
MAAILSMLITTVTNFEFALVLCPTLHDDDERPNTDQDLAILPHVVLSSDTSWDPTLMHGEIPLQEEMSTSTGSVFMSPAVTSRYLLLAQIVLLIMSTWPQTAFISMAHFRLLGVSLHSDQELPHLHAAWDYAVMDGLCHYVPPAGAHLHDFNMDLHDSDVAGLILDDNSAPAPLPPPEPPPRLQNSLANTFPKVASYLTDISVDPKQPAQQFSVQLICIPSVELDGETPSILCDPQAPSANMCQTTLCSNSHKKAPHDIRTHTSQVHDEIAQAVSLLHVHWVKDSSILLLDGGPSLLSECTAATPLPPPEPPPGLQDASVTTFNNAVIFNTDVASFPSTSEEAFVHVEFKTLCGATIPCITRGSQVLAANTNRTILCLTTDLFDGETPSKLFVPSKDDSENSAYFKNLQICNSESGAIEQPSTTMELSSTRDLVAVKPLLSIRVMKAREREFINTHDCALIFTTRYITVITTTECTQFTHTIHLSDLKCSMNSVDIKHCHWMAMTIKEYQYVYSLLPRVPAFGNDRYHKDNRTFGETIPYVTNDNRQDLQCMHMDITNHHDPCSTTDNSLHESPYTAQTKRKNGETTFHHFSFAQTDKFESLNKVGVQQQQLLKNEQD